MLSRCPVLALRLENYDVFVHTLCLILSSSRSLNAVQHRQESIGARPPGADAPQIGAGAVGNHRNIGKLVFPMCSESFQNMDSIRIHLMKCVN
ncbi:hypothetical protein ATANTOWER_003250 [Ataeniobius toweri]|uniref:Uncharacterized protein n=1 Tax=Ataeniobius toweri TaxID=208326 RepID=A0ABU7BNA0_9TELE|nr:hypothetical protein [Ataeniobius toweri]